MFTIAHELAHVWVGQSALFELTATTTPNHKVEKYCNAVAAEFLTPAEKLKASWDRDQEAGAAFAALARRFKVSPIVVARQAKDCQLISTEAFFSFYKRYMQRERIRQEERRSGGNFWLTQNVRLGRRFGAAVLTAAEEGRISYTDAYDLTRLHGDTFDKYARNLRQQDRG